VQVLSEPDEPGAGIVGLVRWGSALAGGLACVYPDDPDQRGDVIAPEGVLVPGKLIGIDVSWVAGN